MTALILLLPDAKRAPNAARVRTVAEQEKATVASIYLPAIGPEGQLNSTDFAACQWQNGVDLSRVGGEFKLREVVLVSNPSPRPRCAFSLLYIWNFPESTFNIDAVRIPHLRKTDPRNNPIGKNPGNIWSFSVALNDGSLGVQKSLFQNSPKTLVHGALEVEAIDRLIECHTGKGDSVYVWAAQEDARLLHSRIISAGRKPVAIVAGSKDSQAVMPLDVISPAIQSRMEAAPLRPAGKTDDEPRTEFFLVDSRVGLANADLPPIEDMVTSPPYNIGYSPFNVPKRDPKTGKLVAPERQGYQDDLPQEQYYGLLRDILLAVDRRMHRGSADAFVNIKNDYGGGECTPPFWLLQLVPSDWKLTDLLIWRYDISYDPAINKYKAYYEWVFRFTRGAIQRRPSHRYVRDFYLPILKGNSAEREGLAHPAIFPKELVKECLRETQHLGLVVDPFLGSGTTIAAAREAGRPSAGFEINPEYEADIRQRLAGAKPGRRIVA